MKELWSTYFKTYPLSTIQDFIKLVYQSVMGSAHLVVNVSDNYDSLLKEYESITYDASHVFYEEISEDLVRVHLEAIPKTHLKIMHALFMKSVNISKDKDVLIEVLQNAKKSIQDGTIPFDMYEYEMVLKDYIKTGCPVISHSETFRKYYHPHYRLMKKEYLKYIDVLFKIDNLERYSVIAIDGQAASGKSTFASFLQDIYHYPIVHMDDFFLQSFQRSKERLSEAGGNVDYERFLKEVVFPLNKKESFSYHIFDCAQMKLNGKREIIFSDKVIVEGSYSHHPYFKEYATLKIFMDINPEEQIKRIKKRNGSFMAERFMNEWIPMENHYFETFDIKEKADLIMKG